MIFSFETDNMLVWIVKTSSALLLLHLSLSVFYIHICYRENYSLRKCPNVSMPLLMFLLVPQ